MVEIRGTEITFDAESYSLGSFDLSSADSRVQLSIYSSTGGQLGMAVGGLSGSGTVVFTATGGSVDAELEAGGGPSIHVTGGWSCPG